jgi:hypothetical protein
MPLIHWRRDDSDAGRYLLKKRRKIRGKGESWGKKGKGEDQHFSLSLLSLFFPLKE